MEKNIDTSLIYGKNPLTRVVSIEPDTNSLKIFRRLENGTLETTKIPNKYWILANRPLDKGWISLKGDLHYKYGKKFDTLKDMKTSKYFYTKKNADIYAVNDGKEQSMINSGICYYKDMKPSDVAILSFDIETTGLDPNNSDAKVLLISNTFRHGETIVKKLFAYDDYSNEGKMIEIWCDWVNLMDPDCIVGHNIFSFDLNYLNTRAGYFETELTLGREYRPMIIEKYESKFRVDGSRDILYNRCSIFGREICDTLFLSSKFDIARTFPSYGLKPIIKHLNLEKVDRTFYDASKIRHNYENEVEWKKIKDYCIDDSDDALKLFDLMVPAFFYSSNNIPKSFTQIIYSASGSQINSILVRSYLQNGHSIPKASVIDPIRGGISLGNSGIYKNCWKVDIKSCYPSAILINNLYSKEKDPNANMYKICEYFTSQRLEYKRLYKETNDSKYYALDQTAKIFINSIFGFCSAPGLNFNDSQVSAKITEFGRNYLNIGMEWATGRNSDYWINLNKHE